MSNVSLVEDTPAHMYRVAKSSDTTYVASATLQTSVKSWQIDMILVVAGLPALIFFVALGGAFALLGPGFLYLGVLSIRKRAGQGRQLLRIITGAALCFLSAVALLAPVHTSIWHIFGSILGLLASTSYLASVLLTMRKTRTMI